MSGLPRFAAVAAACFLSAAAAAAPATTILVPYSDRRLPAAAGKYVKDVTWLREGVILIATESGVYSVGVRSGDPVAIINGTPAPDGLPEPSALSSDGKVVAAISWDSNSGFALRLADHKRLVAQRSLKLIPMDVAISGERACYLGFMPHPPSEALKDVAAWCGGPSDSWAELKPLHDLRDAKAGSDFRETFAPFGGRMVMEPDGTIDVITSVQPGVFRYGAGGKLKEVRGRSVEELVFVAQREIQTRFASDLENRYRLLLNAQALIDDLVATPDGPAILVRLAKGDKVTWELWYPSAAGGVSARIRLGIERIGPYGHLRCESRVSDLACVGSLPPRAEASVARTAQAWPHVLLFKLPRVPLDANRGHR